MSQIVKYVPKSLYSNYSILTISEILENEPAPEIKEQQNSLQLSTIPFKISQRKLVRASKR